MEITDYKPNSHKSKMEQTESSEDRKKVEKVVTGAVKTKKKTGLSKFTSLLVSEDAGNVKSYVFTDVLIPAMKKLISDIVTDGIDMILYGGSKGHRNKSTASKVSYRSYFDQREDRRPSGESRTRVGYSYDDVIVENRGEAEDVIFRLTEIIDTYGHATVADLYDLVGITGNYTDNKYGWTNLHNAEPIRVNGGYLLKLPKVTPIN